MVQCSRFNPPDFLKPGGRNLLNATATADDTETGSSVGAFETMPSPSCAHDPMLADFGDCAGIKASNTFAIVTRITSGVTSMSTPPTG